MKRVKTLLSIMCLICLVQFNASGNGFGLRNLSWNQAAQTVSFEVRWFNAWRFTTGSKNWDAVWIFVKFRECGSSSNLQWTHGLISTNLADHTFPTQLEPTLSDGSAVGIDPAPNNTGVMLRPTAIDTLIDTLGWYPVTLKITNLPTTGSYDLKVFGIEMVFIPQDSFYLGGLNGCQSDCNSGAYAFTSANWADNCAAHPPIHVTSENALTVHWYYNVTRNLSAAYPKGYKAFYCMKYEISEGQYRDFLNTLPEVAASARYLGNYNSYRNQLNNGGTAPHKYQSNREDRAQNWMCMADLMGYLDWAALRPMTELEYEKICRGPDIAINHQYPWGTNTDLVGGTTFNITPENGTELFTDLNANCTYNNVTFSGGDGGKGPARVGIHVKPGQNDRIKSGLSYYGVPDMAGNVWEMVVNAHQTGYTGNWGDGYPDPATGLHNQTSWPANSSNSGFGYRGGSWADGWANMRIASRCSSRINNNNAWSRHQNHGGRGVR